MKQRPLTMPLLEKSGNFMWSGKWSPLVIYFGYFWWFTAISWLMWLIGWLIGGYRCWFNNALG